MKHQEKFDPATELVVSSLAQLRRKRGFSQTNVSDNLSVTQPSIARLEGQTNMRLSTLRRYVEALGGELHLVASFPDQRLELDLPMVSPIGM